MPGSRGKGTKFDNLPIMSRTVTLDINDAYTLRWAANNGQNAMVAKIITAAINRATGSVSSDELTHSPTLPPAGSSQAAKIAVVVGHNLVNTGFFSKWLAVDEFAFNSQVAAALERSSAADFSFRVFFRKNMGSYSREIDDVYRRVNEWGPAMALELHFNAASGSASYACALVSQTSKTAAALGNAILAELCEATGFRNSGLKEVAASDRGGRSLYAGKCPTVLLEPFFGDNRGQCETIAKMGPEGLAEIYRKGLLRLLTAPKQDRP